MPGYADLADLPEDDRIKHIGRAASQGLRVAVLIDREPREKAERYIAKILERWPGVAVLERLDGPTPAVVSVIFGRK